MKWQHQDFGPTRRQPAAKPKLPFRPSRYKKELGAAFSFILLAWVALSVHPGNTSPSETVPSATTDNPESDPGKIEKSGTSTPPETEAPIVASPEKKQPSRQAFPLPRNFPHPDTLSSTDGGLTLLYDPDSVLQASVEKYLRRYRPERAVVLACDLRSGVIKAFAERDSLPEGPEVYTTPRLALRGTFPAASLSKIVTAYAALGAGYVPGDSLPQQGSTVTLYRRQLREPTGDRYPKMTLKYGFAQSANPLFGLLGLRLGGERLQLAAEALGFNRPPVLSGMVASIYAAPDSGFPLAEVASGFTRRITLSPWHALALARAIGDDGNLRPLAFPVAALDADGRKREPWAPDRSSGDAHGLNPEIVRQLREMMEETVRRGTARKGFLKSMRAEVWNAFEMGGKTGSLDGDAPAGRYEWYAGYAKPRDGSGPGLALCVLTINGDYLAVHTTHLAGLLLKDWGRAQLRQAKQETRQGRAGDRANSRESAKG